MGNGLTAAAAAEAVGKSERTLYRWRQREAEGRLEPERTGPRKASRRRDWPPELVQAVKDARDDYPMWGKAKIAVELVRRAAEARKKGETAWTASESTVGRIIKDLVRRGSVKPVWHMRLKAPRAARSKRPWARRKPDGRKPKKAGETVQIDTMAVTLKGGRGAIRQFTASDPVSKWTCAKAYSRATARNASDFLGKVLNDMPFNVEGIQVDGGSEFMAEFEQECQIRGIPLWVLPPRSPKLNGNVERTNQTWRYEFYGCWELPDRLENINLLIDAFADEFNRVRPHRHLDCKTPEQAVRDEERNRAAAGEAAPKGASPNRPADASGPAPEAGGTKKNRRKQQAGGPEQTHSPQKKTPGLRPPTAAREAKPDRGRQPKTREAAAPEQGAGKQTGPGLSTQGKQPNQTTATPPKTRNPNRNLNWPAPAPNVRAASGFGTMGLSSIHLLGVEHLAVGEIAGILDLADRYVELNRRSVKSADALAGMTQINMFFESSTRTQASFEIAGKRLGADVMNMAMKSSSVRKGETLIDTAMTLNAMHPDLLVVRHHHSGAVNLLAEKVACSVVNAGDGTHEHPTQALLDALTIRRAKGRLEGLVVAICGDIAHSRVARSNFLLLGKMGNRVRLVGPRTLMPSGVEEFGFEVHADAAEGLRGADVVMMLRLQTERMDGSFVPSMREYYHFYGLDRNKLAAAKSDAIVMHPGPMNRGVEIDGTLADDITRSVIQDQVEMGVAVRMAVLDLLARRRKAGCV